MQEYGIGRMLGGTKWDSEQYDIKANLDRTLTYGENAANIRKQLGISTRNKGLEQLSQQSEEKERERARRKDSNRQTGPIQSDADKALDELYSAMRPGKRISASGHRYYERRENRSDKGKYL